MCINWDSLNIARESEKEMIRMSSYSSIYVTVALLTLFTWGEIELIENILLVSTNQCQSNGQARPATALGATNKGS